MFNVNAFEIVAPGLRGPVGDYLDHGRRVGLALATVSARERHLVTFLIFAGLAGVRDVSDITPTLMVHYTEGLTALGVHPATVQAYLHTVAMFLRWCSTHPRLVVADGVLAVLSANYARKQATKS